MAEADIPAQGTTFKKSLFSVAEAELPDKSAPSDRPARKAKAQGPHRYRTAPLKRNWFPHAQAPAPQSHERATVVKPRSEPYFRIAQGFSHTRRALCDFPRKDTMSGFQYERDRRHKCRPQPMMRRKHPAGSELALGSLSRMLTDRVCGTPPGIASGRRRC
jgi:hypothetical protein